jgi:hypothetical protein
MPRHALAVPVTLLALLVLPAIAQADKCPKRVVDVTTGDATQITDYHDGAEEGEPLSGGKLRYPGHFFRTAADIKFKLKGNTYELAKGSVFKFTCYGASAADPNEFPAVGLMRGQIDVATSDKSPGGVLTTEGLFDPRQDHSMPFRVSRTLTAKHESTLNEMLLWFAGIGNQPKGTTRVASQSKAIVGVTPYVGKRKGSCRYIHEAKLTSTGFNLKTGFYTGKASYTP